MHNEVDILSTFLLLNLPLPLTIQIDFYQFYHLDGP